MGRYLLYLVFTDFSILSQDVKWDCNYSIFPEYYRYLIYYLLMQISMEKNPLSSCRLTFRNIVYFKKQDFNPSESTTYRINTSSWCTITITLGKIRKCVAAVVDAFKLTYLLITFKTKYDLMSNVNFYPKPTLYLICSSV